MKRHFLSIILLLLVTASALAQTIEIVSIEELTTDLQARTNPRRDLNGEPCALVKIALPSLDDLEFSGNVVGTVVYRNGVYNVYVPAGTKRISFTHNDLYPGTIDFEASGVKVSPYVTYSVLLKVLVKNEAQPLNEGVDVEAAEAQDPKDGQKQESAPVQVLTPLQPAPEPELQTVKEPVTRPESEAFFYGSAVIGLSPGSGDTSFGAMAGWAKKIGGYAKFLSSINAVSAEESFTEVNLASGWTSGENSCSRMSFTLGAIFKVTNSIYPYVGAGYGNRSYCTRLWSDGQEVGRWVEISDRSCSGVSLEAGVMFKLGPAVLSLGSNCIAFRYTDVELGIGISF